MVEDNEEYGYEESSPEMYGAADLERNGMEKQQKVRRLLFGLGLVLVVFAAYKLIGVVLPTKEADEKPKVVQKKSTGGDDSAFQQSLSSLQKQDRNTTDELNKIKLELDDQEKMIKSMSGNFNQVNQNIQALSKQIMQQQQEMKQLQMMIAEMKKAKRVVKPEKKKIPLYINAISSSGRIYIQGDSYGTYKMGDRIPGYGVVSKVDVARNVVWVQDAHGRYHEIGFAPGDQ